MSQRTKWLILGQLLLWGGLVPAVAAGYWMLEYSWHAIRLPSGVYPRFVVGLFYIVKFLPSFIIGVVTWILFIWAAMRLFAKAEDASG